MSYKIEMYVKRGCPYCDRAKDFLMKRSLDFKEIIIDNDISNRVYLEMCSRSGGCVTVPQIFINDQHIGGSDELLKWGNNPDKFYDFLHKK